jgi:glycine oxidase
LIAKLSCPQSRLPLNQAPNKFHRSAITMIVVEAPDIIVVGAGIIGVSLALELRARGARVMVLDRAMPGQEASSAAAGMLAAADPETPLALREFALESARIYPAFVAKLEKLSGISTDFRRHGSIIIGELHTVPSEYRRLRLAELRTMEPALNIQNHSAHWLAEDSVHPVLLMKAALRSAEFSGVHIRSGAEVEQIRSAGTQVEVLGRQFRLAARTVVDCRGAWSGPPVIPRKGQMLYLRPLRSGLVQHVVRAPGAYIVPRSSGRILVGTTLEDAGFDKSVQMETIHQLHNAAAQFVPELASASVSEYWAGLRPGTPDDLPMMGPTDTPGLFIATGHFRNGILLAPLTAITMANIIEEKPAGLDVTAFAPLRFARANVNKAS